MARTDFQEAFHAIGGPAAWRGDEIARVTDWIHNFSDGDIAEMTADAINMFGHAAEVFEAGCQRC